MVNEVSKIISLSAFFIYPDAGISVTLKKSTASPVWLKYKIKLVRLGREIGSMQHHRDCWRFILYSSVLLTIWHPICFLGLLHFGAIHIDTTHYLFYHCLYTHHDSDLSWLILVRKLLCDIETRIQTTDVLWITVFKDLQLRLKIKAFRVQHQERSRDNESSYLEHPHIHNI